MIYKVEAASDEVGDSSWVACFDCPLTRGEGFGICTRDDNKVEVHRCPHLRTIKRIGGQLCVDCAEGE